MGIVTLEGLGASGPKTVLTNSIVNYKYASQGALRYCIPF